MVPTGRNSTRRSGPLDALEEIGDRQGQGGGNALDVDNDGWIDLVVANDTVQNFLFRNKHNGTFEEVGARSSIAFDEFGAARGAIESHRLPHCIHRVIQRFHDKAADSIGDHFGHRTTTESDGRRAAGH